MHARILVVLRDVSPHTTSGTIRSLADTALQPFWIESGVAEYMTPMDEWSLFGFIRCSGLEKAATANVNDHGLVCHSSTDNPTGRWDYWCIGGRFSGSLVLRDDVSSAILHGHHNDPRIVGVEFGGEGEFPVPAVADAAPFSAVDTQSVPAFVGVVIDGRYHDYEVQPAGVMTRLTRTAYEQWVKQRATLRDQWQRQVLDQLDDDDVLVVVDAHF